MENLEDIEMPKPYSIDLRERVIKAYHHDKEPIKRKENTISGVSKRFGVSVKFVKNLLKLYQETGSVTPRPHGGGQTPKLKAIGLKFIKKTVKKSPDLTIDEYTQIYNDNFDEPVSA
jgi:transposase